MPPGVAIPFDPPCFVDDFFPLVLDFPIKWEAYLSPGAYFAFDPLTALLTTTFLEEAPPV